ncbi:hybrid signal transduction histidine kinase M-like isoform X2 [Harpegnathos saltator]|uniref:hybrid signal transduction histidine kinase M-like isoform X2 n=1 Tax=Harpegnathos saltator TaxID=610380 RepID=UPI000DBEED82|nr:hybrid signal transduction histidine kinase M-like isoform X2 [Harpegnathos saltator]
MAQSLSQISENVEIHLLDENDVTYTIKVSPNDAARAENERAKSQDSDFDAASLSMESSNSEDNNESMFKWSHAAILLLVEKYRLQENNIVSGKMSQKKVWNNIASALSVKGYNVTGPEYLSKFHGMKRTYKSIKDHNSKSGNNLRTWPYMEVMESLLSERPFMSPPAIASSSSMCSNSRSNRESNLSNANICNNANSNNKNLAIQILGSARHKKVHQTLLNQFYEVRNWLRTTVIRGTKKTWTLKSKC